jgi:hypothetical protein
MVVIYICNLIGVLNKQAASAVPASDVPTTERCVRRYAEKGQLIRKKHSAPRYTINAYTQVVVLLVRMCVGGRGGAIAFFMVVFSLNAVLYNLAYFSFRTTGESCCFNNAVCVPVLCVLWGSLLFQYVDIFHCFLINTKGLLS